MKWRRQVQLKCIETESNLRHKISGVVIGAGVNKPVSSHLHISVMLPAISQSGNRIALNEGEVIMRSALAFLLAEVHRNVRIDFCQHRLFDAH